VDGLVVFLAVLVLVGVGNATSKFAAEVIWKLFFEKRLDDGEEEKREDGEGEA
jgi:hypothetical protein